LFLPYVSENVCYVFFYNLKHLEIFVIFGTQYPDIYSFKQMYNFPLHLSCVATLPENTSATETVVLFSSRWLDVSEKITDDATN